MFDLLNPQNIDQLKVVAREQTAAIAALLGMLVEKGVLGGDEFEQRKSRCIAAIDQCVAAAQESQRTKKRTPAAQVIYEATGIDLSGDE